MSANIRHAKFAARILAQCKDSEEMCGSVVEVSTGMLPLPISRFTHTCHQSIAGALPGADPDLLAAHMAVLAQLALRAPDAFEQKSDVVTSFLIKKILMKSPEPSVGDLRAARASSLIVYRTTWTRRKNG